MTGARTRVTYGIRFGGALLLLAPSLAAAQDQLPAPKQETVTIRAVGGTFELKGLSSPASLGFTQRCESKPGASESTVLLTLPLEIEAGPNESLEHLTELLRTAVAQGLEVSVEPSSEAGQVVTFYWSGKPQFRGVIASIGVKYTLFLPDGTPSRATANIKVKQAGSFGSKEDANKPASKKKPDCSSPKH
jgi:hypothetical protein